MDQNKETGSYYTPHDLIDFMIKYLKSKEQNFTNVLEPSAGDGRFLSVLLPESNRVMAIEKFDHKVKDIQSRYLSEKLEVLEKNFLDYVTESQEKYSLIIGNPPYINPKKMNDLDIKKAKEICQSEKIEPSVMQNMWLAFVVGACKLLEKRGTIFFVLPMEFLQVQYAEKLRAYLESKFNVIHILSFNVPIFPKIEQDVCLVYMTNKEEEKPYISYEIYENMTSLEPVFENAIMKNKPLKKWSNAVLTDSDILLLKEKKRHYREIKEMGTSAPGIVTGGNKYFIISPEKVKEYKCEKYVLPILQKSSFVSENTIYVDEQLRNDLKEKNKPMYLLNLSNVQNEDLPKELKEYLDRVGVEETGGIALKKRYKCANREPWYGVPIVNKGEVIFFKRYHIVPRIYINKADIHTTDAGYHIKLNPDWDKNSFVFCFYNSLTLAQCEFQGRYYGGGVSELVPSEFKELQIPYHKIKEKDVRKLNKMFRDKVSIESIVEFVNERTIALDMEKAEIQRIEEIRQKLLQRRHKR